MWKMEIAPFLGEHCLFWYKKYILAEILYLLCGEKLSQDYKCHVPNPIVRMNFDAERLVNSTSRFRLIGD